MADWDISGAKIASMPADASTDGSPSTVCTVNTVGGKDVLFRSAEAAVRSSENAFTCTGASEACSAVTTRRGEFTRLTCAFVIHTRALSFGEWLSWATAWHIVVLFTGSRRAC